MTTKQLTPEQLQYRAIAETKKQEVREAVYCDQLQAVFTEVTGLATSLGTMGR